MNLSHLVLKATEGLLCHLLLLFLAQAAPKHSNFRKTPLNSKGGREACTLADDLELPAGIFLLGSLHDLFIAYENYLQLKTNPTGRL